MFWTIGFGLLGAQFFLIFHSPNPESFFFSLFAILGTGCSIFGMGDPERGPMSENWKLVGFTFPVGLVQTVCFLTGSTGLGILCGVVNFLTVGLLIFRFVIVCCEESERLHKLESELIGLGLKTPQKRKQAVERLDYLEKLVGQYEAKRGDFDFFRRDQ